MKIDEIESN